MPTKRAKRSAKADVLDAEIVGEIIEGPGVRVSGRPRVVAVEPPPERPRVLPPDLVGELQGVLGGVKVPAAVAQWAPIVREGVQVARSVLGELAGLREALEAVLPPASPAPRRLRSRRR